MLEQPLASSESLEWSSNARHRSNSGLRELAEDNARGSTRYGGYGKWGNLSSGVWLNHSGSLQRQSVFEGKETALSASEDGQSSREEMTAFCFQGLLFLHSDSLLLGTCRGCPQRIDLLVTLHSNFIGRARNKIKGHLVRRLTRWTADRKARGWVRFVTAKLPTSCSQIPCNEASSHLTMSY